MKSLTGFTCGIFFIAFMLTVSCKRENSCEGCATKNNKTPIAIAGPDQLITLPTDSVLVDSRTSSDPDGNISSYLWTKISGPASLLCFLSKETGVDVQIFLLRMNASIYSTIKKLSVIK